MLSAIISYEELRLNGRSCVPPSSKCRLDRVFRVIFLETKFAGGDVEGLGSELFGKGLEFELV